MIRNYSRHRLTVDQEKALDEMCLKYAPEPLCPVFKSGKDVFEAIDGAGAALVAPISLVLDALMYQPTGKLVCWENDPGARARGVFALSGVTVYDIEDGSVVRSVRIQVDPTVEVDQAGVQRIFAGEGSR